MSNKKAEVDLVAGLPEIAAIIGASIEGARYLWQQGRLPAVKIGPALAGEPISTGEGGRQRQPAP